VTKKPVQKSVSRIVLRLAAGLVLCAGLGGPSPGYTGGCGSNGGMVADARQFCVDKETYTCARECATGRYSPAVCEAMCQSTQIQTRCSTFGWGACSPSQATTAACIQALRDTALLDTPAASITECSSTALCAGSALTSSELTSEPEGI
jgi:hypothetical protein